MAQRVVLIDDDARNLDLLVTLLDVVPVEIERYTDGRAALVAMSLRAPDLVLLDLVMPGLDGLDVLNHMRADPALGAIPVILVTAYAERERRLRGLEAGADEFLEKPIDAAILQARVRTLLRLKGHRDDLLASRHALRATNAILERRNDDLTRLQQQQRDLMAFVVHDLKAPLTAMLLSIEEGIRLAAHWDPRVGESLVDALTSAQRIRAMIDDLLAVSLLEEAKLLLHYEPTSVGSLLNTAATMCSRQAAEKHIAVEVNHDRELLVEGDGPLLLRVIQNLLDNSMRFTPPDGRIAVEAHVDPKGEPDVTIVVSNSGPPIPEADRARIFDKFVRDAVGGGAAGLGLYFCRCVVEAHHGDIRVVDRPSWPTSFEIRLPTSSLAFAPGQVMSTTDQDLQSRGPISPRRVTNQAALAWEPDHQSCRVVLVDDDPTFLRATGRILKTRDVEVVMTSSVDDALAEIRTGQVDTVVSDIWMPRATGIDLLQQVRSFDVDLPVILLTGRPDLDSAERAADLGATLYLHKGIPSKALRDSVAYAVRAYHRTKAGRIWS